MLWSNSCKEDLFQTVPHHSGELHTAAMVPRSLVSAISVYTAALLLSGCAFMEKPNRGSPTVITPPLCKEGPPAWTAPDGRQLAYRTWPARSPLRALIVAVPGWDSTMCDAEALARYLAPRRIQVFSLSVRGQHGDLTARAMGTTGNIDTWRHWPEDLLAFTEDLRHRYPGVPIFWQGQSVGAAIVLEAAAETRAPSGPPPLILHTPAVAITHAPLWERTLAHFLGAVAPNTPLPSESTRPPPPAVSRNIALDIAWRTSADRVRPGFAYRFVREVFVLGSHARGAVRRLRQPVLVLIGGQDPIAPSGVGVKGYEKFLRSFPSRPEVRIFPEGVHDLYHDQNAPAAFHQVSEWIDQTLAARRAARERATLPERAES